MTTAQKPVRETLLGVVLCGGRSSRMGRDKANLVTRQGLTFLDFAVHRLRTICAHVCVSAQADRHCDFDLIPDPRNPIGPIGGVIESLSHARDQGYEACLFTPVDTPHLSVSDLSEICDAFQSDPTRVTCAVKEGEQSFYEPLIAVYPITVLPAIKLAATNNQFSLQKLLKSMNAARVELPSRSCLNLNTPTDLSDL